jgi:hypothetical protein
MNEVCEKSFQLRLVGSLYINDQSEAASALRGHQHVAGVERFQAEGIDFDEPVILFIDFAVFCAVK